MLWTGIFFSRNKSCQCNLFMISRIRFPSKVNCPCMLSEMYVLTLVRKHGVVWAINFTYTKSLLIRHFNVECFESVPILCALFLCKSISRLNFVMSFRKWYIYMLLNCNLRLEANIIHLFNDCEWKSSFIQPEEGNISWGLARGELFLSRVW